MTDKSNLGKLDAPKVEPECCNAGPTRNIPIEEMRAVIEENESRKPEGEPAKPGLYSIGSTHWNGLSKLIEECGEVVQVCGKLLGNGGKDDHWDGSHLPDRLEKELADLCAAIQFVIRRNNLSDAKINARVDYKIDLFDQWNGEQR